MSRLRCLPLLLTLGLALVACRAPSPTVLPKVPATAATAQRALFAGMLIASEGEYQAQAIASTLASGATLSLIDPATSQVKGTGLTDAAGNFTVMALPTFTPALNTLYVLEASKAMGSAGTATLAMRTLVSLSGAGWTSVSGSQIVINPMTTAVALLQRYRELTAAQTLGKVSFDPVTRRSLAQALDTAYPESLVRQVATKIEEAFALNLDPMQAVRPGLDGAFTLSLSTSTLNLLENPSFEQDVSDSWMLFTAGGTTPATLSLDASVASHRRQSLRYTVSNAGDTWLGQGYISWFDPKKPLMLKGKETYTFSIYAKGQTGSEKINLIVRQENLDQVISPPITLTTSFQRYSLTYTATASAMGQVFVRPGSGAGQATYPEVIWLDAAQMEVGAVATPFMPEAGRLLYDSTVTAASTSTGVTYAAGYNGGTGLVLDAGVNLIPNGHAQSGTATYVIPNGGVLTTTTAHGLPPSPTGSQTFLFTHDASVNPNYASVPISVKPHTTYTLSAWVCAPSAGNPASFDLTYGLTEGVYMGRGVGTTTLSADNTWRRVSFTFTTGPLSSLYAYPVRLVTANTKVAFTMFQVEEGGVAHPYTGDPSSDRFALDERYVPRQRGTLSFWFSPFYDSSDTRSDGTPRVAYTTSIMGISQKDDLRAFALYKEGQTLGFGICTPATWYTATWTPPATLWTAGSWHHVAMTWGAPSGMTLYFDGRPVASDPYSGGIYAGGSVDGTKLGNLLLSGASINATYAPNATFDRLRIHDYPRAAADIAREALGIQHPAGL